MNDKEHIADLLEAGEDYLFMLADVISGRIVQYPDRLAKARRKLLDTVEVIIEASKDK